MPVDARVRCLTVERGHELVASTAIGEPRTADVSVVSAGGDELGHRQLLESAWSVGQALGGEYVLEEVGGQH